jgi:hypothetical protein
MSHERKTIDTNPDHVVVEYARLGANKKAADELRRRIERAPYWAKGELRARLAQAVELFAEARKRNDKLGLYRR